MPTQPTKSMTPETDTNTVDLNSVRLTEFHEGFKREVKEYVSASFARSLELRLNAALAENEELRKDKERLAWLDVELSKGHNYQLRYCRNEKPLPMFSIYNGYREHNGETCRQAIDSAIQSTNKPK